MLPSSREVVKETIIVLAGAVLAAFIVGQLPPLRAWMRAQWDGTHPPR